MSRPRSAIGDPNAPAARSLRSSPPLAKTTGDPLLVAERHREIGRLLAEHGSVRVSDLARRIDVSAETIRRDLRAFAHAGVADTVHGGAILRRTSGAAGPDRLPVDLRHNVERPAKEAIGRAAAARVTDGQVVILDAGTTTLAVAQALAVRTGLTLVTNSLTVAQVAATLPHASTYVIGGKLVATSLSMIGPKAQRDLQPVRADWAFLGAAAIDAAGGFTSADAYEAEVKRAMIRAARKVAIVADHTKFDSRRFASFAEAGDIDVVFTTPGVPPAARRWLTRSGVEVVLCATSVVPVSTRKR